MVENGCLKVVAGTHTKEAEHTFNSDGSNMLSQGQEIAVEVDENDATLIQLRPGQFSAAPPVHLPRLGAEPQRRAAHRHRRPLHEALQAGGGHHRHRHSGARQRPVRDLHPQPVPTADMAPESVAYLDEQLVSRHGDRYRK
ncbi:phytanoyl-CoA dioxygenase family protein [Streptomyces hirsutus]